MIPVGCYRVITRVPFGLITDFVQRLGYLFAYIFVTGSGGYVRCGPVCVCTDCKAIVYLFASFAQLLV